MQANIEFVGKRQLQLLYFTRCRHIGAAQKRKNNECQCETRQRGPQHMADVIEQIDTRHGRRQVGGV